MSRSESRPAEIRRTSCKAWAWPSKMGLHTVALTGATGGKLKAVVDYCVCAPSNETPRIQECHILIGHIISELVEQTIFHDTERRSSIVTA